MSRFYEFEIGKRHIMKNNVYTLNTVGVVEHPKLKLNRLIEYFIIADFSQTYLYSGEIASLKYIMNNHIDNIKDECRTALTIMLERYFDAVSIEVTLEDTDASNKKALVMSVTVTEDGKTHILDKEVYIVNDMLRYNLPHSDELYSHHMTST